MFKFKPAKEVLALSNNITVNLKQMSGDIISLTYDSNKEPIEEVIKRDIINKGYRGYRFSLIKDGKYYSSEEEDIELNDGDMLDIFISPKNYKVLIIFLEKSLLYNSPNDMSAWIRDDFYDKYLITITEKYDKYEYIFYFKNDRYIPSYIPSSSICVINEGKYDDEDHIMIIEDKPVFSNLNDMFDFILRDLFDEDLCGDIKDKIISSWNTGEIKNGNIIYLNNEIYEYDSED